ncbi:MAG: FAD-dependent oxidoreductase [Candidatus Omnitrophica bacterium]|nr:FAD-dependent oxidoreductase [Candidatus Omnitrophota bacterium]
MADEKRSWSVPVKLESLPDGKPVIVRVAGQSLILVREGSRVYAFGQRCPHYGMSLESGKICGGQVVCPWHQARFDLNTGRPLSPPGLKLLEVYQVRVVEGMVLVEQRLQTEKVVKVTSNRQIVIAGAGAAGVAAAMTLRRCGFDGQVTVISPESDWPYDRPSLTKDYLLGSASEEKIALFSPEDYQRNGIQFLFGRKVVGVQRGERKILLDNGQALSYEKLILATGGQPRKLGLAGAKMPGVFYLRTKRQALTIREYLPGVNRVVVIGSGFLGLETAASLRKKGLEVYVVTPENFPLGRIFGEHVGKYFLKIHQGKGINFYRQSRVVELISCPQGIAVLVDRGERVEAEMVIVGVGMEVDTSYLEKTGLNEIAGVPVDTRQRTADPDILAAGDLALVPDWLDGGRQRVEHWAEAERQGQEAARSVLELSPGEAGVPFFWTTQYNILFRYVGFSGKFDQVCFRGYPEEGNFLAGYFYQGRIAGCGGVGFQEELMTIRELLASRIPVKPEQFTDSNFDLRTLLP